jgi:hypothetical protein
MVACSFDSALDGGSVRTDPNKMSAVSLAEKLSAGSGNSPALPRDACVAVSTEWAGPCSAGSGAGCGICDSLR